MPEIGQRIMTAIGGHILPLSPSELFTFIHKTYFSTCSVPSSVLIHSLWKWHSCPLEEFILLCVISRSFHYRQSLLTVLHGAACISLSLFGYLLLQPCSHLDYMTLKSSNRQDPFVAPFVENHVWKNSHI